MINFLGGFKKWSVRIKYKLRKNISAKAERERRMQEKDLYGVIKSARGAFFFRGEIFIAANIMELNTTHKFTASRLVLVKCCESDKM